MDRTRFNLGFGACALVALFSSNLLHAAIWDASGPLTPTSTNAVSSLLNPSYASQPLAETVARRAKQNKTGNRLFGEE